MIKSTEFNLSCSTNSNSNLEFDHDVHDPHIHFIDNPDENNNDNKAKQCMNTLPNNHLPTLAENPVHNNRTNHHHPPVKFVTHFSNIKEDES